MGRIDELDGWLKEASRAEKGMYATALEDVSGPYRITKDRGYEIEFVHLLLSEKNTSYVEFVVTDDDGDRKCVPFHAFKRGYKTADELD